MFRPILVQTYHSISDEQKSMFGAGTQEAFGKCPKCGAEVKKGKYGFYCIGKCGMNVAKVYGKELTEKQLSKLLSGQQISYTIDGKKTTVMPEVIVSSYNGKDYFQWKTKHIGSRYKHTKPYYKKNSCNY